MRALTPEIAYAVWCIIFALLNSIVIEKLNEKVMHWFNGLMHLTVAVYFGLAIHWIMFFTMPFIGRVFFDIPLNLFRHRPFNYVPSNPKSLFDKIEKGIFGNNGYLPKFIYITILIGLLVIQFKILK